MRKGFKETLATVAIAMLGFNAMAMAPMVGDIPDIIVGDAEDTTGNNVFVFPDAFNLDSFVSDDTTDDGDIIWSYGVVDPNDNRYTFNANEPLDGEDPVNPGSKRIDDSNDDPYWNQDADPRTVTIRDELRSPAAGDPGDDTVAYGSPGDHPIGVLADERTITLFASDGATVGMGSFIVWSESGNFDGFSPRRDIVYSVDFTAGIPEGWNFVFETGDVNDSQNATDGLCLEVPAGGDNIGEWTSAYGDVSLVPNSVWEARFTASTNKTSPGETPLWQFVYVNQNPAISFPDPGAGKDEFGGEFYFYDNEGGANSARAADDSFGREEFRVYMIPPQGLTPQFEDDTDGFYRAELDEDRGFRFRLRVLDSESAGYSQGTDGGSICFGALEVARFDLDTMIVDETVFQTDTFVNADTTPGQTGSFGILDLGIDETVLTFESGNARLSSNGTMWGDIGTATVFRPGPSGLVDGGITNPDIQDWFPIEQEPDTLYYVEFEVSAPSQTDEVNPVNVLRVGAEHATGEIVTDHFAVPNTVDPAGFSTDPQTFMRGISTPRSGAPQKYVAFFYSHSVSQSGVVAAQNRFAPRLDVLGATNITPFDITTMDGDIMIHSVTVNKVSFAQ